MKLEEHCAESIRLFGKAFEEVHRWLDEYAGSEKYGMRHRRVRHHEAGIRAAKMLFGEEAARAARQHVVSDLRGEGRKDGDPFPRDEQDYVRMGFF